MGAHSPYSSSIDSNNTHSVSSASSSSSASLCPMHTKAMLKSVGDSSRRDLSTDLRLGLTISSSSGHDLSQREQCVDWPPIKQLWRSSLVNGGHGCRRQQEQSLFVKVYMEGIPIGRKVDLYALDGYSALIHSLSLMFTTTILCPETDGVHSLKYHILTYEDQEGDWMMVGDVPWEMFVSSVKRLKIRRGDRC